VKLPLVDEELERGVAVKLVFVSQQSCHWGEAVTLEVLDNKWEKPARMRVYTSSKM
jgi:hypothetical protein